MILSSARRASEFLLAGVIALEASIAFGADGARLVAPLAAAGQADAWPAAAKGQRDKAQLANRFS